MLALQQSHTIVIDAVLSNEILALLNSRFVHHLCTQTKTTTNIKPCIFQHILLNLNEIMRRTDGMKKKKQFIGQIK